MEWIASKGIHNEGDMEIRDTVSSGGGAKLEKMGRKSDDTTYVQRYTITIIQTTCRRQCTTWGNQAWRIVIPRSAQR